MKRIISLICVMAMICCALASCGEKPGEFVKLDPESINSMAWITGGTNSMSKEDINKIAEIYNGLTPDGGVSDKLDEKAEWRILVTELPEGSTPSIFRISYIGDFRFTVRIDGPDRSSYTVTSEELYNALEATR